MTKDAKKTTLTLGNGKVVDCGVAEKKALKKAILNQSPKQIVMATMKLLISSDRLVKELAKKSFDDGKTKRKRNDLHR
jgi:hypothetical protein